MVLKNKEYADISLLCLQLLTQNVAQNKPLINICWMKEQDIFKWNIFYRLYIAKIS